MPGVFHQRRLVKVNGDKTLSDSVIFSYMKIIVDTFQKKGSHLQFDFLKQWCPRRTLKEILEVIDAHKYTSTPRHTLTITSSTHTPIAMRHASAPSDLYPSQGQAVSVGKLSLFTQAQSLNHQETTHTGGNIHMITYTQTKAKNTFLLSHTNVSPTNTTYTYTNTKC